MKSSIWIGNAFLHYSKMSKNINKLPGICKIIFPLRFSTCNSANISLILTYILLFHSNVVVYPRIFHLFPGITYHSFGIFSILSWTMTITFLRNSHSKCSNSSYMYRFCHHQSMCTFFFVWEVVRTAILTVFSYYSSCCQYNAMICLMMQTNGNIYIFKYLLTVYAI